MTAKIRILHLDTNHPLLWKMLENAGFLNELDATSNLEEVLQKIHLYDGIVIRSRFKLDADFLKMAKSLKFIARVGAGLESIDLEFAQKNSIHLIAAPEGNSNAVGEHALGMLLGLMNKLNLANTSVKSGLWQREIHRGYELEGKTVGIIGYGHMGRSFAKKLSGFDCQVVCYDILPQKTDAFAQQVDWETFCRISDVVSLHTPLTPETHQMVNQSFWDGFQKPIWFINTARGKSVVTADLVQAIKSGKVLGAGLDVLEYEKTSFETLFETDARPEALDFLLHSDQVLLSPHVAGWTFESHQKLAQVIADKIIDWSKNN